MDLDSAVRAHAEWKTKFRSAIAKKEQLDAARIQVDNACPLGQWLHGEARTAHGKLASYGPCVEKHAAFHKEAGRIAAAINAGDFAKAEAMMAGGTTYSNVSSEVGVAIIRLRTEARL